MFCPLPATCYHDGGGEVGCYLLPATCYVGIDIRVDCGIMHDMNDEEPADDVSMRALMIVVVRFLRFLARWFERRYVTMR